jgi:hypothetical protein
MNISYKCFIRSTGRIFEDVERVPYCIPARGCENLTDCLFKCTLKDQIYEYLDECKEDCPKTYPLEIKQR